MSPLERPYNFSLLDDIHNLFPEILYDPQLFPGETNRMINWLRYRIMHLFPQTFRRCRLNYELRLQTSVRNDYDDWMFLSGLNRTINSQVQMPPYRNEFITPRVNNTTYAAPNTTYGTPNTTYGAPNTVTNNYSPYAGINPVVTWNVDETNLGILSLALLSPAENWLASFFDTVPLRATNQEIELGSELLQSTSVAGDVICTICQEHDQSTISGLWRRIRRCNHFFHQNCVDRWFLSNPYCPVCRADIREQIPVNPQSAPSSTEPADSPM